jgi:hypothetical protein
MFNKKNCCYEGWWVGLGTGKDATLTWQGCDSGRRDGVNGRASRYVYRGNGKAHGHA